MGIFYPTSQHEDDKSADKTVSDMLTEYIDLVIDARKKDQYKINELYTIRYNKTHCNKNKSLIYCGIRKIITQDIVHKELYRRKIC